MAKQYGKMFETDAGFFVIEYRRNKKFKLHKVKLQFIKKY
jgi:hypothetical protein